MHVRALPALATALLVCMLLALTPATAEITSRELVGSFRATAWDGGARAVPQRTSSFWGNPAVPVDPTGAALETGVFGLDADGGGMVAWTAPVGSTNGVGLAWRGTPVPGLDYQELMGVLSLNPTPRFGLGLSAQSRRRFDDQSMDFGVGMRYAPHRRLAFGADLRRAAEALDPSEQFATGRLIGVGVVWQPLPEPWVEKGVVSLDWENGALAQSGSRLLGGLGLFLGPEENFSLLGSVGWGEILGANQLLVGGGVGVQERFWKWQMGLDYTVHRIAAHGRAPGATHGLGLTVRFSPGRDAEPPRLSVALFPPLLVLPRSEGPGYVSGSGGATMMGGAAQVGSGEMPAGALENTSGLDAKWGTHSTLDFQLQMEDASGRYRGWNLVIASTDAELAPTRVVKSFGGPGLAPRAVRWNGYDTAGMPLPPGIYAFRLIARDRADNVSATRWSLLEIR